jgi:molybdate transport system permease protein
MDWTPFTLSLWVACWASALALLFGTPIAWMLARFALRGKWIVEGLIMAPLVLPPTLLGYYLLIFLGQRGIGAWLEQFFGIRIVFSPLGAIIAATIAALPLVIQAVQVNIATLSREVDEAGRLDGCTEWDLFRLIHLPLIWPGLLAGAVLGFLRALSDFGATLMVAGNIPGRTQTMSMAIYDAVQANNMPLANELAIVLTTIGFGLLFIVLRLRQKIKQD